MSGAVVVTGAGGAVGSALLEELARESTFESIIAVYRTRSARQLAERTMGIGGNARTHFRSCDLASREEAAALGESLPKGVRYTGVHAAADVSWGKPAEALWASNVEGTLNFAEVIHGCGRDSRFVYVSSAYAEPSGNGYRNGYEETKAIASRLLRDRYRDLGPATFAMSLMIGRSDTGQIARFHGLYPLIEVIERYNPPILPGDDGVRIDLVPVDWVATELAAHVRAVASGDTHDVVACAGADSTTIPALLDAVVAWMNAQRAANGRTRVSPIAVVPVRRYHFLRRTVEHWSLPDHVHESTRLLDRIVRRYLPYLQSEFAPCPAGVRSAPPLIADYLPRCLEYWADARRPASLGP